MTKRAKGSTITMYGQGKMAFAKWTDCTATVESDCAEPTVMIEYHNIPNAEVLIELLKQLGVTQVWHETAYMLVCRNTKGYATYVRLQSPASGYTQAYFIACLINEALKH